MIEIPLTQGQVTIVDDEDAYLTNCKWLAKFAPKYGGGGTYLAARSINRSGTIYMHRVIMAQMSGRLFLLREEQVDHIDLNPLNNRRSNLRLASQQQNSANQRKPKSNTSGFKGVSWDKENRKWKAQITHGGANHSLGRFDTPEEAHAAYCKAAEELHGEFARVE